MAKGGGTTRTVNSSNAASTRSSQSGLIYGNKEYGTVTTRTADGYTIINVQNEYGRFSVIERTKEEAEKVFKENEPLYKANYAITKERVSRDYDFSSDVYRDGNGDYYLSIGTTEKSYRERPSKRSTVQVSDKGNLTGDTLGISQVELGNVIRIAKSKGVIIRYLSITKNYD